MGFLFPMESSGQEIEEDLGWYCFRAWTRREHVAAVSVEARHRLEVFAPRLSILKKTRMGTKRFIEPLFPGYLFVRCRLALDLRRILATEGVTGVVRYGDRVPGVPPELVVSLRESINPTGVCAIEPPELRPGLQVRLTEGALHDFPATILSLESGKDRVVVLMEFLGRQQELRISRDRLWVEGDNPRERVGLGLRKH